MDGKLNPVYGAVTAYKKVDATGTWLNNSTMVFQQDGGGKILMDPKYGIVAGTGTLYDTEGTTVKPGFIDENGMIVLDKDGMPRNSNFFLDLRDGSAYFRGTVYADGGRFKGSVYGDNYYFNDGGSVKTLISEAGVDFSKMKRIDLGGIVLDGETGNISFTGAGSITWGDNTPVKYQFSTSLSGPWHDTMQTNDKYRRDSLDGGTTWGTAYQFRGTDGKNGSSANVTRNNIAKAMLDHIEDDGLYAETINGKTVLLINASAIKSGSLTGIDIYGGAYHDLSGRNILTIGTTASASGQTFGDLSFSNDGEELFSITDLVSDVSLKLGGVELAYGILGSGEISLGDNVIVHATFA